MHTATHDRPTIDDVLGSDLLVTDGGLETHLVFEAGIDLPDFAAFPLVDDEEGRAALLRYYRAHLDVAGRHGLRFVIDTPTWRANPDWGARLGYGAAELAAVNRRSVDLVRDLAAGSGVEAVVNGVVGPRGDGYVVGATMSASEAAAYHALQARAFADAGADLVTSVTMTSAEEAVGVVRAVTDVGLPTVVGFTVETDGRLPSGQPLGDAVAEVDARTDGVALHVMVNCAHPTHVAPALATDDGWSSRIGSLRANASRRSHAELDAAEELDRGDPRRLAADVLDLARSLPALRVVGGCCGTDAVHVDAIVSALVGAAR